MAPQYVIAALKFWLFQPNPPPEIIQAAQSILNRYPRSQIPDWVEILANGNLDLLTDVIEIARSEIVHEHDPPLC